MTAYEFRGFIANLILDAIVAGSLLALTWNDPIPLWAYILIAIGMVFAFPLPVANFKLRPVEDKKVLVPDAEKRLQKS